MDKSKGKIEIIDLNNYRKNKTEERKREYERVVFNRVLGVYSYVEHSKLSSIEVQDISPTGVRFREISPEKVIKEESDITLRFYFTPSSFLRVVGKVKRVTSFKEKGREGVEYGCELDKKTKSYEVIKKLISFLQQYSEVACQDQNPPMNFY